MKEKVVAALGEFGNGMIYNPGIYLRSIKAVPINLMHVRKLANQPPKSLNSCSEMANFLRQILERGQEISKKDWKLLHVAVVAITETTYIGRLFFGDAEKGVIVWDCDCRPSDACWLALKVLLLTYTEHLRGYDMTQCNHTGELRSKYGGKKSLRYIWLTLNWEPWIWAMGVCSINVDIMQTIIPLSRKLLTHQNWQSDSWICNNSDKWNADSIIFLSF